MPFCRPSVEKYIFSKVNYFIPEIFKFSYMISYLLCMQLKTKTRTKSSLKEVHRLKDKDLMT